MILMRWFVFLITLLFLSSSAFCLDTRELKTIVESNYLVNPLDGNEDVTVMSYSRVNCPGVYWVLPVSGSDDFVFLNDLTSSEFVDSTKAKELLITVNFFTSLGELYYNSQSANYFETVKRNLSDFSYNLTLIEASVTDAQTITQIGYVKQDITNMTKNLDDVQTKINDLSDTLIENRFSCAAKTDILIKAEGVDLTIKDLDTKIQSLLKNISWLRNKIADLNIDYQQKVYISDQITVPESIARFPEQKNYFDASLEALEKAAAKDNGFGIDLVVDSWKTRKERALFLSEYLTKDADVKKKTNKETPKDLFDYILINKNNWSNETRTAAFLRSYDELLGNLNKKDYVNAKSKIAVLKLIGYDVYKAGFKEQTTVVEEQPNDYKIYIYAGIAILFLLILPRIIAIIKGAIKKDDEKKEPEVNIDLPN